MQRGGRQPRDDRNHRVRAPRRSPRTASGTQLPGLNRALALPAVLLAQFAKPAAIFAPDPAKSKPDHFRSYDVRVSLSTIEPSAIRFGLPVNTQFGWSDHRALASALEARDYRDATVALVAWEHVQITDAARDLMHDFGADPALIPDWPYDDFDAIYVVHVVRSAERTHASFERRQEHLDGQATTCPGSASPAAPAGCLGACPHPDPDGVMLIETPSFEPFPTSAYLRITSARIPGSNATALIAQCGPART